MHRIVIAVVLGMMCASVVSADVRTDEKTQVRFEGMLGRMVNLFGGRAAKDGIVRTVAVKGDRKATLDGETGQIIDLNEEKIYDLDIRKKAYTVTTFAELRRQMEEARKKAAEQAPPDNRPSSPSGQPQLEVDFDVKESGQKRVINGFDAREVVMTISVREKGKTIETSGGFVVTSNTWLTSTIDSMAEVAAFDRRYAEKLSSSLMLDAQQMAMILAMYPMMREAMAKFEAENVNMNGTPVMTVVKFEAVANPAEAQQAANSEPADSNPGLTGLGGLGGRLGRRLMNRGKDDQPAAAATNRATVMTMQQELLKVSPAVSDGDVAIPAGFKARK